MKLIELFFDDVFRIPLRKGDMPTANLLKKKFDVYLRLLDKLSNDDKFTDTIKNQFSDIEKLCNRIISAVKHSLQGSPHKAYNALAEGISALEGFLYFRITERVKYPESISLFRVRSSQSKYLSRKDMFHVPFHLRGKVRNQRFSISGFPCLYLGSSIYVCWEELNRPDFGSLFISKFRLLTKQPGILDLTFSVDEAKGSIEKFRKDDPFSEWLLFNTVEKIILFPLILSCSIINKESTDVFKEEYIIPQLLLEWVNSTGKINAIEYLSSGLPDYSLDNSLYRNYVFPTKRQKEKGYCSSLSGIFELTNPISWTFAQNIHEHIHRASTNPRFDFNILNQSRSYANTTFGNIERIINSMEFRKLEGI